MNEELLQFIWDNVHFNTQNLKTTNGKEVLLINQGTPNPDAGPDFFNAKIKIDNTTWAGNIEVHNMSSNWMQHGHQFDDSYNNVILHVVYEHDENVVKSNGNEIPTLELKSHVPLALLGKYSLIGQGKHWIACESVFPRLDIEQMSDFLQKLAEERLMEKAGFILEDLKSNQFDWQQTFYEHLARNFGFKTNALPFQLLAKSLPIKTLARHASSKNDIEALLFGQAGFLDGNFEDEYPNRLKETYIFYKKKYQLQPIHATMWKFATMRPANFPTIRLAQFASLVHSNHLTFSKVIETSNENNLYDELRLPINKYWETHYHFEETTNTQQRNIGASSIANILINTVVSTIFAYARYKDSAVYKQRAFELLSHLPAESNGVINHWKKLGITPKNALHSQALLQLKNMHCTPKKCLSCKIGSQILNNSI